MFQFRRVLPGFVGAENNQYNAGLVENRNRTILYQEDAASNIKDAISAEAPISDAAANMK